MIKPDGMRRSLRLEIERRLRSVPELEIVKYQRKTLTQAEAEEHYEEHRGKRFFNDLVMFTISGPMIIMVLEGDDIITRVRRLMGPTRLFEAHLGTIRGDLAHFGASKWETIVHGSDSPESAEREIALHFGPEGANPKT